MSRPVVGEVLLVGRDVASDGGSLSMRILAKKEEMKQVRIECRTK